MAFVKLIGYPRKSLKLPAGSSFSFLSSRCFSVTFSRCCCCCCCCCCGCRCPCSCCTWESSSSSSSLMTMISSEKFSVFRTPSSTDTEYSWFPAASRSGAQQSSKVDVLNGETNTIGGVFIGEGDGVLEMISPSSRSRCWAYC